MSMTVSQRKGPDSPEAYYLMFTYQQQCHTNPSAPAEIDFNSLGRGTKETCMGHLTMPKARTVSTSNGMKSMGRDFHSPKIEQF